LGDVCASFVLFRGPLYTDDNYNISGPGYKLMSLAGLLRSAWGSYTGHVTYAHRLVVCDRACVLARPELTRARVCVRDSDPWPNDPVFRQRIPNRLQPLQPCKHRPLLLTYSLTRETFHTYHII